MHTQIHECAHMILVFKVSKIRRVRTPVPVPVTTRKKTKKRKRDRGSLSTDKDRKSNKIKAAYNQAKEEFLAPYRARFDEHVENMAQNEHEQESATSDNVGEDPCLFCFNPIAADTKASLDCGHTFCLPCVEYWFATSGGKKCPYGWCKKIATAIINSQGLRLSIPSPPVRPERRRKYDSTLKLSFVRQESASSVSAVSQTMQLPPRETILKLPCVVRHVSQVVKERVNVVNSKWARKLDEVERRNNNERLVLCKQVATYKGQVTKQKNEVQRVSRLRQNVQERVSLTTHMCTQTRRLHVHVCIHMCTGCEGA